VIDFVRRWNERTEIATQRFVRWLGVASSKFYDWRARYGQVNEHNGWVPRDFWLAQLPQPFGEKLGLACASALFSGWGPRNRQNSD
jgi:hypothetical protein